MQAATGPGRAQSKGVGWGRARRAVPGTVRRPGLQGRRAHALHWPSPPSGWPAPTSPPGSQDPGPGDSREGPACLGVCRTQSPHQHARTARAPPARRRRGTPGEDSDLPRPDPQGPARPLPRPLLPPLGPSTHPGPCDLTPPETQLSPRSPALDHAVSRNPSLPTGPAVRYPVSRC